MLEHAEELVALRVDASHPRAVLLHHVDQPCARDEDRETADRVPGCRCERLRGLERRIGVEPHRRRRDRDGDAGPSSQRPCDRYDPDEVEEREAELGSGHHVDEADERDEREPEERAADDAGAYRVTFAMRARCLSSIARICSG